MRNRSGRRWLLPLTTIVGTLGLGAGFVTQGLASLLTDPSAVLSDAALADRKPNTARAAAARRLGEQVLSRNIFDSSTGPLSWEEASIEPQPARSAPPMVSSNDPPERCGAGLRLVASVVNVAHPERSFAAVRKDEKTELVGLGGQLGDHTLFALRPARAYLQSAGGSLCFLPVFLSPSERPRPEPKLPAALPDAKAASARAAQDEKPKSKSKPPLFTREELARGVTSLGRSGYAVSRELVLRALKDPGGAAAGAQFKSVERDGHSVGMEIRAVRDGSPLQAMGVQNGDVVRSLNGADLTTPVGLLSALKTVRDADSLTLVITRENVTRSIQYLLD